MKPQILIVSDFYLPAYRAGGPPVAIHNIVRGLSDRFAFRILCRAHDLGDWTPLSDSLDRWTETPWGEVFYCSQPSAERLGRIIDDAAPDLIYVNSLLSRTFSIGLFIRRRLRGLADGAAVVLDPRGELHPGALQVRYRRKQAFLRAARAFGLHRRVHWQATNETEAEEIQQAFGGVRCSIAPDVFGAPTAPALRPARPDGPLRVVFVSRLARKKNVLGAIAAAAKLRRPIKLTIAGPVEDAEYWQQCQRALDSLPPHVQWEAVGPRPPAGVSDLFRSNDVFLFPTLGENNGYVILEALEHGCLPVIADTTPWTDLEAHEAGYVLPPDAVDAFAQRIDALAAAPPAYWAEVPRRTHAYLCQSPQLRQALDAHAAMFERAISESHAGGA